MKLTLITVFAILALAACGRPQDVADRELAQRLWLERQRQAAGIETWDMYARAAVTLEAEAYNINFHWRRDDAGFTLLLEAPFGQGVFRIESTADDGYRLRLPDGREFANQTPEQLLEEVIGWSLPLGGLEFWVRGLARPGSDYRHRLDRGGRPSSINQDRWQIDYIDYFAEPAEMPLPRRVRLARDEIALKLVIERWQPVSVEAAPSDLFPEFN